MLDGITALKHENRVSKFSFKFNVSASVNTFFRNIQINLRQGVRREIKWRIVDIGTI